ncbi:hypothetical protein TNCV_4152051 [Trichonephila clavipes]|nr:hypothetical protein TNCV_4152051 [Trichonephila clavipes]
MAYGIGLGHDRTAMASHCKPFAWYLCPAESKNHRKFLPSAVGTKRNRDLEGLACRVVMDSPCHPLVREGQNGDQP